MTENIAGNFGLRFKLQPTCILFDTFASNTPLVAGARCLSLAYYNFGTII